MSLLRTVARPRLADVRCIARRLYASKAPAAAASKTDAAKPAAAAPADGASAAFRARNVLLTRHFASGTGVPAKSSCPEGTVLQGLQWKKDQPPVLALADDAYPDWLWTLLEPKVLPDDGPGGLAEKRRMRRENRLRIREQNFMKTQ